LSKEGWLSEPSHSDWISDLLFVGVVTRYSTSTIDVNHGKAQGFRHFLYDFDFCVGQLTSFIAR
jgi:hypothetical protein